MIREVLIPHSKQHHTSTSSYQKGQAVGFKTSRMIDTAVQTQGQVTPEDLLKAVPCKWFRCTSSLDCYRRFRQHVLKVHVSCRKSDSYECLFERCGERFFTRGTFKKHVQSHLDRLPCLFQNCTRTFAKAQALESHRIKEGHPEPLVHIRRRAAPRPIQLSHPLPDLPIHRVPTRDTDNQEFGLSKTSPAPIPPTHHRVLGPWVLRLIVGDAQSSRAVWTSSRSAKASDEIETPSGAKDSNFTPQRYDTSMVVERLPSSEALDALSGSESRKSSELSGMERLRSDIQYAAPIVRGMDPLSGRGSRGRSEVSGMERLRSEIQYAPPVVRGIL